MNSPIKDFIKKHYRHFNAAVVVDASEAYVKHLEDGGKMFLAMAGAMSTGEKIFLILLLTIITNECRIIDTYLLSKK